MLIKHIDRVGRRKYAHTINRREPDTRAQVNILGFDTEYDSITKELLTVQLYGSGGGSVVEIPAGSPFTKDTLFNLVAAHYAPGPVPDLVYLVTYFSAAELQHLDTIHQAVDHMEYAAGFMDCTFEYGHQAFKVYDLARWYGGSGLAKVAESYGMRKLTWDRTTVSRSSLDDPAFQEYALHDARLCFDIFNQLAANFGTVGADILAARTAPGAAAVVFRSRLDAPLELARAARRDQAMRSYWGGRAEVFGRGRFPSLAEYDLKSAYPAAAVSIDHFPLARSWACIMRPGEIPKWRGGLATVDFKYPAGCQYPGLPVAAGDGMLIYPLTGRSSCTFDECVVAMENGADLAIVDAYAYDTGSTALADYMAWAIENRRTATGPVATMWKLLANSLIGKFAQRVDKYHIKDIYAFADALGLDYRDALAMNQADWAALETPDAPAPDKKVSIGPVWCPEWSALIMGRTRAELAAAMPQAAPVYCHTDSIWTAGPAPAGRWLTWEHKGTGPATVIRSRMGAIWYDGLVPHIAHHSIWDGRLAESILYYWTPDAPPDLVYHVEKPARMVAAARRKVNPGTWVKYRLTASTTWDHKRELLPDGTTRPWRSVLEYHQAARDRAAAIDPGTA